MSKTASLALAAAFALFCGAASADQAGPDWMAADQVIAKLRQAGYTRIDKIEADDGRWEGEGLKNGQRMEFRANATTGAIMSEKPKN